MDKQRNCKRVFSFGLMLCLVAVLSLSTLFIVTHADHDCTGHDCRICYEINGCVAAVQHMSEALGTGSAFPLCAWAFLFCTVLFYTREKHLPETLVALKIRLDN